MDAPAQMYFPQMFVLLLLLGICTFWLGRLIQWLLLRKSHPRRKIFFILIVSLLLSYLLALLFWFIWPQPTQPMWTVFFLPAVTGELIILVITVVMYKRRKPK
ncbi:MAG: hypothetical protein V5804_10600 [Mucilaginibacter sp.]|uniref:hypothetical protein n=1 Tax=Mucilaginibacter sp. TaxID=1882438 RepID=UPI0034E51AA6